MKGVREHMMKYERRCADGDVPIGEMKLRIGIKLLIGQGRRVSMGRLADVILQESYIGEGRAVLKDPLAWVQPWNLRTPSKVNTHLFL
jgi:hypothetical protein